MIEVQDIRSIVEECISRDAGYFVVELSVKGANVITVVIDHDDLPIDIDTIVELTRYIEERLDRDQEDFELEVSSAGLTTPLDSPRRYRKYLDEQLEVLLKSGVKEHGTLLQVSDDGIELEVIRMIKPEGARRKQPTPEVLSLPYDEIKKATYMIDF
ncbi:MAG: ribosome assembly cofactor RimP [Porphyromonas sp.]|nr:ribosome assembly cofactor RimP [Porphyromonas sp.]